MRTIVTQRHVIYGLYDPRDTRQEIRYVGCTHLTVEQRLIDHISGAKRHAKTHKQKWIRKLLREGTSPAFKILETTKSSDWQERERFWIAELRAQGSCLTNATSGGEGLVNPSLEVRAQISAKVSKTMRGNSYRLGITHSEEDRKKISRGLLTSEKAQAAFRAKRGVYPKALATKKAIRASAKSRTGQSRPDAVILAQQQAEKNKGSFWVNDGTANRLLRGGAPVPEGFVIGRLMKRQMTTKNRRYVTNGIENKMIRRDEPIPEGFRLGQVKDTSWRTPERNEAVGIKLREIKLGYRWITRGDQRRQLPRNETLPKGWRFVKVEVA